MGKRKPPPRDHVARAISYAEEVVAGRILACNWTVLACARHLSDLERAASDPEWPYYFSPPAGARICKFIELLPHVKGDLTGEPIHLEDWQLFILTTTFGWLRRADNLRRFRTVYIEVPRKNAKSTMTSGVGLYMLALDGEGGAECYSAATKRDQAKIVFGDAQKMARRCTDFRLRYGIEVFAHSISMPETGSVFTALDSQDKTQDGLNIHFAGIDELHAHRTRALYEVLDTGTGARSQALLWAITTAGSNRAGICYEQRTYLTKVLKGIFDDETFFGIIYTLDEGDDWRDPAMWPKANPNFGISVKPDDLERQCRKAAEVPSARNAFLTKRLDVWVNAAVSWMDMEAWEACADPALDIGDFAAEECVGGLDLATKKDVNSFVRVFERDGHYTVFAKHYLPQAAVESGACDQYAGWAEEGWLTVTDGTRVDYDVIGDDVRASADQAELRELAYDPHQAQKLINELMEDDIPCVEMRPTVLNFSEPMKELESLVSERRLHHNGDPVLTWMVSNVVAHLDAKDNIYPRKEFDNNKIDGVVALIMALGRMLAVVDDTGTIYDQGQSIMVV